MAVPEPLRRGLKIPAIAAPMFLVSGPDLVVECCRSGVIGTFPALNQRDSAGYEAWLKAIASRLGAIEAETGEASAPFGVNLIVHRSNQRLAADLALTIKHRVPLVITALGPARDVVDAIHAYGGVVFHDVSRPDHAEKAIAAGVDGVVALTAGAGGQSGYLNPFAFVAELRAMFAGTVVLAGSITSGAQIAAAELIGADLAYLGTRFIATRESLASDAYKAMVVSATSADIVGTDKVTGIFANLLRPSLAAAGFDPDGRDGPGHLDLTADFKAWAHLWSAGHGVGSARDLPPAAVLCARLRSEYQRSRGLPASG
jgi:nitronate monooxygenase